MKRLRLRAGLTGPCIILLAFASGCSKKSGAGTGGDGGGDSSDADRQRSQANLKQIGIAFHNYASATGEKLPVGLIDPRSGRTGLSWRVQILPYIEEGELYKQFKLDEPWDSEHNKKLLPRMPKVYAPVRGSAPEGHTFYQGFADAGPTRQMIFPGPQSSFTVPGNAGKGAAVPVTDRHLIASIPDGTSMTFLIAEAGEAVPWTKPQDMPVQIASYSPLQLKVSPRLGGLFDGGFNVVMGDGAVYFVKKGAPEDKLAGFIVPNDGIPVDLQEIGIERPRRRR